jgi:hypothetical protein
VVVVLGIILLVEMVDLVVEVMVATPLLVALELLDKALMGQEVLFKEAEPEEVAVVVQVLQLFLVPALAVLGLVVVQEQEPFLL